MNRYVNVETAEVQEQATLLAEVLQRCIHFLTWPRLRLQLVLLDTVGVAIRALHALDERRAVAIAAAEADLAEERRHSAAARRRDVEFQDDPRLLPAIHGIWPGLAPLLRASLDEEPLTRVVYSAALRVLSALVECASSFIRQRFQTDVWPVLRHNLRMASRWARATHATTATDIDTDAARSRARRATSGFRDATAAGTPGDALREILQSRAEEAAAERFREARVREQAPGAMLLRVAAPGGGISGSGEATVRLQPAVAQVRACVRACVRRVFRVSCFGFRCCRLLLWLFC